MSRYRSRVLLIVIFGGCLMVATRFFYLQVIQGEYWGRYAAEIRLSRHSTSTRRGRILANEITPSEEPVVLAADLPAFDIAVKLSELDDPGSEFRSSLYEALRVNGRRVREVEEIALELVQTAGGSWAVEMSYSGSILRRRRPGGMLGIIWKGRYVRESVEAGRVIPITENVLEPIRNLSALSGEPVEAILKQVVRFTGDVLNKRANSWDARPVLEDVSYDIVLRATVGADKVRGFFASDKRVRRYPQGELAGHVVGYMTKLNPGEYEEHKKEYAGSRRKRYFLSDTIGRSGVEARFNEILRGERGEELVEKDRHGRTVRALRKIEPVPGSDVYLTILPAQQRAAEEAFEDRTGFAAVIDARTGEILVLVSAPRYNPERFSRDYRLLAEDPRKPLFHRAVKSYPLGSSFKMTTALAAWDKGVTAGAEFECKGRFGEHGPRCSARWGHGTIGFHVGLKKSCNVYFCELGKKAGPEKLSEWAMKLGFDQKTAFEAGGEERGYVPSPARRRWERGEGWWSGDTANYSIGQGELLVTPLQAARAVVAVCTDGRLVMPHVVKKIVGADGREAPVPGRPPVEPTHIELPAGASDRIRKALVAVVHEAGGTGNRAFAGWDKPYRIAGKTSTAQRPGGSDLGWFVGAAPADDPRIAFAVGVDLVGREHGGDVAAPVARKIIESFPDEFLTGEARLLARSRDAELQSP